MVSYGGSSLYGSTQYGGTADPLIAFEEEMAKLRDTRPFVQVWFIDTAGNETDLSAYYESGGTITWTKERAPDEIQAGDFDLTLFNHDDFFSEYISGSLFFETQYHNAQIRLYAGFTLDDGSTITVAQALGYIDELVMDSTQSKVTIRCRDAIKELLDQALHLRPYGEMPVPGETNTGDGSCSIVETLAFSVVDENWTLTCTLGGADGVATFGVVGSVTGSVGTATSGTTFSHTGGGIKFTISGGAANWVIGDTFTFSTKQHPEWTSANPAKIIWSVLTGTNYDTGAAEVWADRVLGFDSTRDTTNVDINWTSFVTAVADLSDIIVTGHAPYEANAREFLESLLLLFLGSIYTDGEGKMKIQTWAPSFPGETFREFSDAKKIVACSYVRSIREVINHVRVQYKATDDWDFSDIEPAYDGILVSESTTSKTKYGKLDFSITTPWYATTSGYVGSMADRLVNRYADPPLVISFTTGSDGLLSEIGDSITVTDTKHGFDSAGCEIISITKHFDSRPITVDIIARRDPTLDTLWGFLGSSADEGDGISPQTDNYLVATDTEKQLAYIGQSGEDAPDYRMW